jgi:deoxyribodipyrimidine photo-lyase
MSADSASVIWWIRRDFRLSSHPVLEEASRKNRRIFPVFVVDPRLMNSNRFGARRNAFLRASLFALQADLGRRGSGVIVRSGEPRFVLRKLIEETNADEVLALGDYSEYDRQRNVAVSTLVPFRALPGQAVMADPVLRRPDGVPYSVFTHYFRAWQKLKLFDRSPAEFVQPNFANIDNISTEVLEPGTGDRNFRAGESSANNLLREFLRHRVSGYGTGRDLLDGSGTSRLSPYLRFGVLAPTMLADDAEIAGAEEWLRQLAWRDFYFSLLQRHPRLAKDNLRPSFDEFPWRNSPSDFDEWAAGETGYPVVDAGMRQLLAEGWISNRMRMIVASFLTKHLMLDWRMGESYFMQQLIDGDLASNAGGWQWVAGTGVDASPFFRIFNPVLQGKRFDPSGNYISRWVPELCGYDARWIHEPWKSPFPPQGYPPPMVDHDFARLRALDAYREIGRR